MNVHKALGLSAMTYGRLFSDCGVA